MASREQILARRDRATTVVEVPEWECKVEFRSLMAKERADLLARFGDEDGALNLHAVMPQLIVLSAHDPDSGERIFTSEDVASIEEMDGALIARLAAHAAIVSGMVAGSVDEAGKGSSSTPKSDSGSSSPSDSDRP